MEEQGQGTCSGIQICRSKNTFYEIAIEIIIKAAFCPREDRLSQSAAENKKDIAVLFVFLITDQLFNFYFYRLFSFFFG